jgi:hypothetical protein
MVFGRGPLALFRTIPKILRDDPEILVGLNDPFLAWAYSGNPLAGFWVLLPPELVPDHLADVEGVV